MGLEMTSHVRSRYYSECNATISLMHGSAWSPKAPDNCRCNCYVSSVLVLHLLRGLHGFRNG